MFWRESLGDARVYSPVTGVGNLLRWTAELHEADPARAGRQNGAGSGERGLFVLMQSKKVKMLSGRSTLH